MSDWYYAADNQQQGPVNESELKAHFATHKLPADTLVWKDGMEQWTAANQVPAFSFRQPPLPAKIQPGSPAAKAAAAAAPVAAAPVDSMAEVETEYEEAEKNKVFGIIAYLPLLCFVPLVAVRNSPFAKFHANQGLVLLIVEIVILSANAIFSTIFPALGFISVIFDLLFLAAMILVIIGIINAAQAQLKPLPIIGGIKLLK